MASIETSGQRAEDLGLPGSPTTLPRIPREAIAYLLFASALVVGIWVANNQHTHRSFLPSLTGMTKSSSLLSLPSATSLPQAESPLAASAAVTFPEITTRTVTVRKNETLAGVLDAQGVNRNIAHNIVQILEPFFTMKSLRVGQTVDLLFQSDATLTPDAPRAETFHGIVLRPKAEQTIKVLRNADGSFAANNELLPLTAMVRHSTAPIDSSLYVAATKAGVPAPVLNDLIRIFSFDVDFQREIQPGDTVEVLFEQFDLPSGETARHGNILYAALTLSGKKLPLYRFEPRAGEIDYFDPNGKSARKALIRTPIDGARLSSSFGLRNHPILGFSAMHTGTDFAAPAGTPIYASGNGVIEFIGKKGGYGNYVQIRHNGTYSSGYAHAQSFVKGLKVGSRVNQGETIAYVGATGQATGPHLHYELIQSGKKINAMTVHLPSGETLAGEDLVRFQAEAARIAALMNSADTNGLAPALMAATGSASGNDQVETFSANKALK